MKTETIGKEKAQHTPVPWEANKWASGWEVCAPDSHYTISLLRGCNNDEANAAFICRAVNSHADLLEALKRINRTSVQETFHGDIERFQQWLDAFTADAIQKAEGAL